ncbi:MAG TPA: hypothetical protein VHB48_02240, partial [Chitinophagaceae bacterium]|nr:hypothetical protein [Chitinophagaceae bacterium]
MLASITGGFLKFVRVVGLIIIYIGALIGACGIFLFIFIAQDYEPDKYVRFSSEGTLYETRQYAFGGATLSNTRYTFETYRQYS